MHAGQRHDVFRALRSRRRQYASADRHPGRHPDARADRRPTSDGQAMCRGEDPSRAPPDGPSQRLQGHRGGVEAVSDRLPAQARPGHGGTRFGGPRPAGPLPDGGAARDHQGQRVLSGRGRLRLDLQRSPTDAAGNLLRAISRVTLR